MLYTLYVTILLKILSYNTAMRQLLAVCLDTVWPDWMFNSSKNSKISQRKIMRHSF